jgi:hypothetical protein
MILDMAPVFAKPLLRMVCRAFASHIPSSKEANGCCVVGYALSNCVPVLDYLRVENAPIRLSLLRALIATEDGPMLDRFLPYFRSDWCRVRDDPKVRNRSSKVCAYAAACGRLDILKKLKMNGFHAGRRSVNAAAFHDQFHVYVYLLERGERIHWSDLICAAAGGALNTLTWIRDRVCSSRQDQVYRLDSTVSDGMQLDLWETVMYTAAYYRQHQVWMAVLDWADHRRLGRTDKLCCCYVLKGLCATGNVNMLERVLRFLARHEKVVVDEETDGDGDRWVNVVVPLEIPEQTCDSNCLYLSREMMFEYAIESGSLACMELMATYFPIRPISRYTIIAAQKNDPALLEWMATMNWDIPISAYAAAIISNATASIEWFKSKDYPHPGKKAIRDTRTWLFIIQQGLQMNGLFAETAESMSKLQQKIRVMEQIKAGISGQ